MKGIFYLFIFFIGGHFLLLKDQLPNNAPKYLEVEESWKHIVKSQPVFSFNNPDTTIQHDMHLLLGEEDLPLMYYADIQTPVCIDGLCKPLYIEMYWDLTGQYIGYGVYPNQLLSKFDHDLFEPDNYQKLHHLLSDAHSVIGRRGLNGLYDRKETRTEKIKFKGQEVDAVTGATRKEIKTTIVEGALYSCYTLWHLAYGDAKQKIETQLPNLYSKSVEDYFLNSAWENYQMHAVKQLALPDYEEKIKELTAIVKSAKPLTRSYILKKMPKHLFAHSTLVDELYPAFSTFDFNTRTLLVNNLSHSNSSAARTLSNQLSVMSKNQLQSFLKQLKVTSSLQNQAVMEDLKTAAVDTDFAYAYLVADFLKG